jgi:NitT/TauT family transport system substrate-binding protein
MLAVDRMTADPAEIREIGGLSRRSFLGRSAAAVAASGTLGALLSACGDDDGGGAGGTDKVAFLNIVPINLSFCADLIADHNGYFKKEGLDVTFQATRGSAPAIQSVLAGSALITRAGAIETVVAASTQGAPLMNVGMLEHKSPLWFVSTKERPLTQPQDWEGKTMGLPSKGGTSEQTLDLMLASEDVDPDSVERQVVGLSPGTFELVKKGRIDGYTVGSVDGVIFKHSIDDAHLLDPSKYVKEGQCYLTSKRQMVENEDQVKGYLNGVHKAAEEILDDRERGFSATIKTLRKAQPDLPELKTDVLAKDVLTMLTDSWTLEGRDNLLTTVPKTWQAIYDELKAVDFAEPGKDPQDWYTNDLVST